jgi:hypothetical protein
MSVYDFMKEEVRCNKCGVREALSMFTLPEEARAWARKVGAFGDTHAKCIIKFMCGCGRPLLVARDAAGNRTGVTHAPGDEDHHLAFWAGRGPDQIAAAMDENARATADETECAACAAPATGACRGCGHPLCEKHTEDSGYCRSCE